MTFESIYHGTDARILAMTAEEKEEWKKICIELATTLRPYFPDVYYLTIFKKLFENGGREDIYWNLCDTITRHDAMKNGNQEYQYGEIYLTNGLDRAKG